MRENLDGLTPEEIGELALAYLSLLKLMNEALEECETGWGFFTWTERGYEITGHPPDAVVEAAQAKAWQEGYTAAGIDEKSRPLSVLLPAPNPYREDPRYSYGVHVRHDGLEVPFRRDALATNLDDALRFESFPAECGCYPLNTDNLEWVCEHGATWTRGSMEPYGKPTTGPIYPYERPE